MRTKTLPAAAIAVALLACDGSGRAPAGGARSAAPGVTAGAEARTVQSQVEAYNRRDLDAYMAHFAADARLYTFPDSLLYAGRDTLRSVYGALFAQATGLRAEVTHRLEHGAFVIDREVTTGLPGQGPVTGVAIPEVRGGLITRFWFLD